MEKVSRLIKGSAVVRWSMLVIVGFILAGNYYFYDAISPLKKVLTDEFGFTSTDFGLFVSVYSIPNVFLLMAVLGGIILDKLGIRKTGTLFISLMSGGALLTAYGASDIYRSGGIGYELMNSIFPGYSPELKMMLLGRFFFGLGAETSIVVISKIIVKWFKGKELALAFGIKLGFARIGSVLAFWLSPILIGAESNISIAMWFAAILVTTGLLAFMIYIMFDAKLDKQINNIKLIDKSEQFTISDIGNLFKNTSFIYITLLCVTFYSAVFPFLSYSSDFFLNKFGFSLERSGQISSLLPLGTVLFTPLFGLFVDKKGKSASLMIYGSIILIIVHLLFAFTMLTPYIPMVMLGIAFSLVPAAMWPSVARIVDENKLGTAYGLMFSIQNLGLWALPLLAGIVLDATNPVGTESLNYFWTMIIFAGLGVIGLIFAILLKREDTISGYNLEAPAKKD